MVFRTTLKLTWHLLLCILCTNAFSQQSDSIKYEPAVFNYPGGMQAFINNHLKYSKKNNKIHPEPFHWLMNFLVIDDGKLVFGIYSLPDTNNDFEVEVYNVLLLGAPYWKAAKLENKPISTEFDMNMMVAYNKNEKTVAAEIELLEDEHVLAKHYFEEAERHGENYKKALPYLKAACELDQSDNKLKRQLGICEMKLGDTAKACEIWSEIRKTDSVIKLEDFAKYCKDLAIDNGSGSLSSKEIEETMPSFPGGERGLINYIRENFIYPKSARRQNIAGTIYITSLLGSDGYIKRIRVIKGITDGVDLDREGIRVLKTMPRWKPGLQNGSPVAVIYNLPIRCVLR